MNTATRSELNRAMGLVEDAAIRLASQADDPELPARERRTLGSIADRLNDQVGRMQALADDI